MEIVDILENIDFFKGVSGKSRRALASICMPKSLKKNEILFPKAKPATPSIFSSPV